MARPANCVKNGKIFQHEIAIAPPLFDNEFAPSLVEYRVKNYNAISYLTRKAESRSGSSLP